ncbi:MAG TPA: hypothetical protein DDZ41_07530 [Flavobacterium sp.]|nr:hypothetical protein [Flavobacterium sp.]
MLYKVLKDFLLKKQIKKVASQNLKAVSGESVATIGVLIDAVSFKDKDIFLEKLKKKSPVEFKIQLLVFRKKVKKTETVHYPYFMASDVGLDGAFSKGEVEHFVNFPFDVLISYYDNQNSSLEWVTVLSKAKFKVGLHSIHTSLNHFTINTFVENYEEFILILFQYLKILKKI